MSEYAHPEVLVSTEWVASHLNDPNYDFVEVDVDTSAYDQGHIAGAVGWNWQTQFQDRCAATWPTSAVHSACGRCGNYARYDRDSLRRQ